MAATNQTIIFFDQFISHEQEGSYFYLPFIVDTDVEKLTIKYSYGRRDRIEEGSFTAHPEINIIDLGLIGPGGEQVGASGSDKTEIVVSEAWATPGYKPVPIVRGEWQILVGAYKVELDGCPVEYQVWLDHKELRLLKGDIHTHTVGSDGVHTVEELAWKAMRNGLDFLAVTDHNQMSNREALLGAFPGPGVTLIPGVEWTHYQGHANFMGVDRPFDGPFATNTLEQAQALFESARQRGALIMVNHPFEGGCEFKFDLQRLPFDCIEVWNGPMRMSNLQAVGWWHSMLAAGRKIPACGGSDYHRDTPFIFLGGPTMGVYSLSAGQSDIMEALKLGHSFITYAPGGPVIEMTAGEAIMGDSVDWNEIQEMGISVEGLAKGDLVQVVTGKGNTVLVETHEDGAYRGVYRMEAPGFARLEVLRSFLPGIPKLPAALTNPIYFDHTAA